MLLSTALVLNLFGSLLIYLASPNQQFLHRHSGKVVRYVGLLSLLTSAVALYWLMPSIAAIFEWFVICMTFLVFIPYIATFLQINQKNSK